MSGKSDEQLKIYLSCMEEIKLRISDADGSLLFWREQSQTDLFQLERSALHLRKCYELFAFASMAADLDRYKKARKRYAKEWNFAEITKQIARVNPGFPPKPHVRQVSQQTDVCWHFDHKSEAELSLDELKTRHGFLGNILHASNPFGVKIEATQSFRKIDTWFRELWALLCQHRYEIELHSYGFLIEMNGNNESVTGCIYEAQRDDNVH
ncbi:MAG: hypothetical protein COB16_15200 [Rhodobacteraceae bacterium]|nr:MAG: hypothetical protein COB16_15200 [Paracoccaceae bacterium]